MYLYFYFVNNILFTQIYSSIYTLASDIQDSVKGNKGKERKATLILHDSESFLVRGIKFKRN